MIRNPRTHARLGNTAALPAPLREPRGPRTHVLLVLAAACATLLVTILFLLLIRQRLRAQIVHDFALDLRHSVTAFHDLQAERFEALERENALLAALPTLKALMTSGDDLTIQDGAAEFWRLSGSDLFALADPQERIAAVYTSNGSPGVDLQRELGALLAVPGRRNLIDHDSIYSCSVRPMYFGSQQNGTLLGYVIIGVSLERTVREISRPAGVEAAFFFGGRLIVSTLPLPMRADLGNPRFPHAGAIDEPLTVTLGKTPFLAEAEDLSPTAESPLQLVVLKSLDPALRLIARINWIVVSTGLLALLLGTILMTMLSRLLTRPLEELSSSVRAFGMGDGEHRVPRHGTREVRQLSEAFTRMRSEILSANRALLEQERLATIGRMASSVSHDLRHSLAAVYANAEFLSSNRLSAEERAEIFAEIRTAVHGTTDMIESLLIFSRTGKGVRRSLEQVAALLDRATALIRAHPDAEGIDLTTHCEDPSSTSAMVDAKQIERAVFNLLLNACQSVRAGSSKGEVVIVLEAGPSELSISVTDSGPGVPAGVRESLFEPFVSEGKQKGTGLGLTLAHRIAAEHGGEVILLRSVPGETVFQMRLARALETVESIDNRDRRVTADEKVGI